MGLALPGLRGELLGRKFLARALGFEPKFSVLETVVLPIRLHPNWQRRHDSNTHLPVLETDIFAIKLLPHMVSTAGFEPATPCSQGRCATKLRYAEMWLRG